MLPAIIMVVFFILIGVAAFVSYRVIKNTDPNAGDSSVSKNIETAQEFLPFDDIRDGIISLGAHHYRLYIEVSSINYDLRTNQEREMIDASYQQFLNSLSTDTTIFVQTRKIDTTDVLVSLAKDIQESTTVFPQLSNYGDYYYQEMAQLTDRIGNGRQKKKFIIVSFDEANTLPNLSEQEKYEFSVKEIYSKASMIIDNLMPIGLSAKLLDTKAVAELIYSTYHRDNYGHVKNIVNGEFMTLFVESEKNHIQDMSDEGYLDWVIYQAQNSIQKRLSSDSMDEFTRKQMEDSLLALQSIREKHAGHYIERDYAGYELEDNSRITSDLSFDYEKGGIENA